MQSEHADHLRRLGRPGRPQRPLLRRRRQRAPRIDVGGGYMIVGEDESNVLQLYKERQSGEPVKTCNFTGVLPDGASEIDIEASARVGQHAVLDGLAVEQPRAEKSSHDTRHRVRRHDQRLGCEHRTDYAGQLHAPARGPDRMGRQTTATARLQGVGRRRRAVERDRGFNIEGVEFAPGSSTEAYIAFRAPLEPTSEPHARRCCPGDKLLLARRTATRARPKRPSAPRWSGTSAASACAGSAATPQANT